MKITDFAKNISLSIFSIFIFILVIEFILQTLSPYIKPQYTKVDPTVGWYHNSNVSSVQKLEGHSYQLSYNSHGYRVPEHSYENPTGTKRVVVLGDSFVDGSEVDDKETWTWHLQDHLGDVEVINLGVYSYSTAQELITLEKKGFRYNPDLVILVTMTNDFANNLQNFSNYGPAPRYVLANDSIELQTTDHPDAQRNFRAINLPLPARNFLHEKSKVYYLLNFYVYQKLIRKRIVDIYTNQKRLLNDSDRHELYIRIVQRIKSMCDKYNTDFKVVFVYMKRDVLKDQSSHIKSTIVKLKAMGIDVIDMYKVLRDQELGSDKSLYYQHNMHWNARGHQFVAETLLQPIYAWRDEDEIDETVIQK